MATVLPTLDEQLAPILASDPEAMRDPNPVWRRLREESPVHAIGPVVLVARHADVKAVVRDERGLSNGSVNSGTRMRQITAALDGPQREAYDEISGFESLYVSRSDGDQHDRLREIAHRVFTPRRIVDMRAGIQRYADEMLAAIDPEQPVDLMGALAYRLPLMVIADMLGVPQEERDRIHVWSNQLGRNRGGDDPDALMVAHGAMGEFRHYVEEILVPLRRAGTGTDLVTALLQAEEGARLTPQELSAMFVILLFAGHETTTNLIGIGTLELLRRRDQWELLCAEPELAPKATEELLRFVSPVQWLSRVALEDFSIGDTRVEAGQTVFPLLAAANRDPEVFAEPERLDIARGDVRGHLALGFGPHFCLGNALARLEGNVVFETLARRYPNLELVDEPPGWRGNAMLRGPQAVTVRLGPARATS